MFNHSYNETPPSNYLRPHLYSIAELVLIIQCVQYILLKTMSLLSTLLKTLGTQKGFHFFTENGIFLTRPSKRISMNLYFRLKTVFQMSKYMKMLKYIRKFNNIAVILFSLPYFTIEESRANFFHGRRLFSLA